MEEKKLKISFEKADYLINKLQDILADYLHGGESDEVIAKFEGLLDIEKKHSNRKNLWEFDLEAAKAGKPVCTRDGRKARIICFDREYTYEGRDYSIVALVSDSFGESVHYYFSNGKVDFDGQFDDDLMMLTEKKEGWIIKPKDYQVYQNKEDAERVYNKDYQVIAKISWEE